MVKRVLIANRGEIALRIIRACRELDIETVAVYSQADESSLAAQLATQSLCIGPARAADSYLNQDAILSAALASKCDAIHPGYGFLSENPDFADRCVQAELKYIGPSGDVIRKLGSKSAARTLARSAGVPVVPGSDGALKNLRQAKALAEEVGYPVLLKASAGGGGRGMRQADGPQDMDKAFQEARSEAVACFGDGELYLEKLVVNPRHIEFQIMADTQGRVVHRGTGTAPSSAAGRSWWRNPPPWPSPPPCGRRWAGPPWPPPRRRAMWGRGQWSLSCPRRGSSILSR